MAFTKWINKKTQHRVQQALLSQQNSSSNFYFKSFGTGFGLTTKLGRIKRLILGVVKSLST